MLVSLSARSLTVGLPLSSFDLRSPTTWLATAAEEGVGWVMPGESMAAAAAAAAMVGGMAAGGAGLGMMGWMESDDGRLRATGQLIANVNAEFRSRWPVWRGTQHASCWADLAQRLLWWLWWAAVV